MQWFQGGLASGSSTFVSFNSTFEINTDADDEYRDVLIVGLEVFEDLDDGEGRAGKEALLRVGRGALHLREPCGQDLGVL